MTINDLKGQYKVVGSNPAVAPNTAPAPEHQGLFDSIGSDFNKRVNAAADVQNSNQSGFSKTLQTVGQGAGFVGDILGETIDHTPIVGDVTRGVGEGVSHIPGVQEFATSYNKWKQDNPEQAGNFESVVNIGSLLGGGAGASVAKEAGAKAVTSTLAKNAEKQAVKKTGSVLKDSLELTAPVLNKKATIGAFEQAGKAGGVETEKGILGKIKYKPTDFDKEVAETAAPYISKSKNPAQNNYALGNEIERFSESDITPFLAANPRAVNTKTVAASLKEIPTPDLFKTDPILEKTYDLVRQKMINRVEKSGGNMLDLWNARKEFDSDVLKEFGDIAFDDAKATPLRRAIADMRHGLNDFIGNQIGNDTFKQQMKRLNRLYEARTRIAETNYKLLSGNKFKQWEMQNPQKAALIKFGIGGTGVFGAYSALAN